MLKMNEKGITIITLVITIIIMIILAGITISVITGDGGVVSRARKVKEEAELAEIKEDATGIYYEVLNKVSKRNLNNDQVAEILQEELRKKDTDANVAYNDEESKFKILYKGKKIEIDVIVDIATVQKIDGGLSLSEEDGTYTSAPGTFIVTNNVSNGELTVSSSDNEIATATIDRMTVTVTPGTKEGTAIITVRSAATATYKEATATFEATTGHNFASETVNNTYLKSAATCTNAAEYYYKCTRCAEKGVTTYTNGNALGHDYTSEVVNATYLKSTATCTNAAQYYYKCSRCTEHGTTAFSNGNALGHDYTSKTVNSTYLKSAATCTAAATYYYKCSRCTEHGTTSYSNGSALGHNYNSKTTTSTYLKSAATCTAAATYYYKCSRCTSKGTTSYSSGSALGHNSGTTYIKESNFDYTKYTSLHSDLKNAFGNDQEKLWAHYCKYGHAEKRKAYITGASSVGMIITDSDGVQWGFQQSYCTRCLMIIY